MSAFKKDGKMGMGGKGGDISSQAADKKSWISIMQGHANNLDESIIAVSKEPAARRTVSAEALGMKRAPETKAGAAKGEQMDAEKSSDRLTPEEQEMYRNVSRIPEGGERLRDAADTEYPWHFALDRNPGSSSGSGPGSMNPFDFRWFGKAVDRIRRMNIFGDGSNNAPYQASESPETDHDRIRRMVDKDPRFDAKGKDELARRVVAQLPTIVERKMGVGDLIADEAEKLLRETGQDRKR